MSYSDVFAEEDQQQKISWISSIEISWSDVTYERAGEVSVTERVDSVKISKDYWFLELTTASKNDTRSKLFHPRYVYDGELCLEIGFK